MTAPGLFEGDRSAILAADRRYRYQLRRQVGAGAREACFVMLNPSKADEHNDDATIRRCIGFATRWGCGVVSVVNLFAWRATDPLSLVTAADPEGPDNHRHVIASARAAQASGGLTITTRGLVVCAWGAHGRLRDQDLKVLAWLRAERVFLHCLGTTALGDPCHPVRLPYSRPLEPFRSRTPKEV